MGRPRCSRRWKISKPWPSIARRCARTRGWRSDWVSLAGAVQRHPPVTLLAPQAGWSAVLRVPSIEPEETIVSRLIEQHRVLVHPGYFFDFPAEAFIIISLLPPPDVFDDAISRMLPAVAGAQ